MSEEASCRVSAVGASINVYKAPSLSRTFQEAQNLDLASFLVLERVGKEATTCRVVGPYISTSG